jgi:TatD DNase family protein
MGLIDIGVNLTNKAFKKDLDQVIERARSAGVEAMVVTGTSIAASRAALELAKTRPGLLHATAGVHPHDAKSCNDDTIDTLRELARHDAVVAIGECGLDYNRDFSPRPVQDRWFEAQLRLAEELGLPLFLHERDAHARFLEILRPHRDKLAGACVHCFTGTEAELRAYLDLDLHIGITGWIADERRGRHLFELAKLIPMERLMIETDAPYLLPRNIDEKPKGGRNEPAFLTWVAKAVAEATGLPEREVADATGRTARAFFRISNGIRG